MPMHKISLTLGTLVVASTLSVSAQASIAYKYFLKADGIITATCQVDGDSVRSKLNLTLNKKSSEALQVRIEIKACTTSFGMKKFIFFLDGSPALFDEKFLLSIVPGSSKKAGSLTISRESNQGSVGVYSVSPKSLGSRAQGVESVRFFIPLDPAARQRLLSMTNNRFIWSGVSIVYKKGLLVPRVNLRGNLSEVEQE